MAFATVGTNTSPTVGSSGAAVTPSWGTGQSRTAGDLLLCQVAVSGSATLPTTPSGWSVGSQQAGANCSVTIFYKVAAGIDAAPTIAAITSGVIVAWLGELSGGATVSPVDQTASAAGTTTPQTATCSSPDQQADELVIACGVARYTVAGVKTLSQGFNNSITGVQSAQNNSTSTTNHYNFAYGTTTANASSDQVSLSFTTTNIGGAAQAVASFKLASSGVTGQASLAFAYSQSDSATVSRVGTASLSSAFELTDRASVARVGQSSQTASFALVSSGAVARSSRAILSAAFSLSAVNASPVTTNSTGGPGGYVLAQSEWQEEDEVTSSDDEEEALLALFI